MSTVGRRLSSVVGVASRMKLSPAFSAGRQSSSSSSGGRSTTISPSTPAALASARKRSTAVDVDRIVVAHQHDRRVVVVLAEFAHQSQRLGHALPALSARKPAAWIAGPSAIGSVNGMPSSMMSAPGLRQGLGDGERRFVVGIARHDEGHQRGAAFGLQRGEAPVDAGAHRFLLSRKASTDGEILVAAAGKIDHHQMILRLLRRKLDHLGQRMRRLERRDDALELAAQLERRERFVVGGRQIFHAAHVVEPGMLRTDAGIIEAGGDRMRFLDLAVVIHQQICAVAVQHARAAAGNRGRVLAAR